MKTKNVYKMTKAGHISLIKAQCVVFEMSKEQMAYVLATVEHETGGTFEPVREAFFVSKTFKGAEKWRLKNLSYYPYYGRGYVQITWKANYQKFQDIMNEPFVEIPDLVMVPENAAFILCYGVVNGTFTGRKISDYINDNKKDYHHARRCINGLDRARLIANLAEHWEVKL